LTHFKFEKIDWWIKGKMVLIKTINYPFIHQSMFSKDLLLEMKHLQILKIVVPCRKKKYQKIPERIRKKIVVHRGII
jgi:hypothetical protein